jgi:hypothetical protein
LGDADAQRGRADDDLYSVLELWQGMATVIIF